MTKCHECSWSYEGKYPTSSSCPNCYSYGSLYHVPDCTPTTQKAKGVVALATLPLEGSWSRCSSLNILRLLPAKEPIDTAQSWPWSTPVFARPCPPNPEHGFVESRQVKDWAAVEQVRQETFAACPDAEIMLVPWVNAKWNALWTPALLTIGDGHDGATAGRNTINFPLAGQTSLTEDFVHGACGVKEGCGPYVEAVVDQAGNTVLTQLRGGPVLASGLSLDNIPEPITVTQVLKTNGEDLLEWARITRAAKGTAGLIVWHPGGSPTDHYSVHCREQGIPLAVTFEPQVGQTYEPTGTVVPPLDPYEVCLGLAAADRAKIDNTGPLARAYTALGLLALHNSGVLRGQHSYWLGVAAGAILKLGSAALRGEARHALNRPSSKIREEVHKHYMWRSLSFHRAGLSRTTQLLTYGWGDPTRHTGGFGGPKWGLCGAALCPMFNAVRDLFNDPTAEHASALVIALNIAINQAHNGGWWLNKFIAVQAYSSIPNGELPWILQAVPAIDHAWKMRGEAEDYLPKLDARVKTWPVTDIAPLKWRRVTLDVGLNAFVLNLKAATVPNPTTVTIPVNSALMNKLIKTSQGMIKINPGSIDLVVDQDGAETLNVWKEYKLAQEARQI